LIQRRIVDKAVASTGAKAGREATTPNRVTSTQLLAGKPELIIVHDGREYRLRITQNGKLILTA
jgi:hemin uptake protein HemP